MNENIRRCFDLTVEIEELSTERTRLEFELTADEGYQLVALLKEAGEAKLDEAAQLESETDVLRATGEI